MVKLSPKSRDVIVGLLLSDGWLSYAYKNPRLGFNNLYLIPVMFDLYLTY